MQVLGEPPWVKEFYIEDVKFTSAWVGRNIEYDDYLEAKGDINFTALSPVISKVPEIYYDLDLELDI